MGLRLGIAVKKLHPDMCREMDMLKKHLEKKISELGVPEPRVTDAQVSKILSDKLKAMGCVYNVSGDKRKRSCKVVTEIKI